MSYMLKSKGFKRKGNNTLDSYFVKKSSKETDGSSTSKTEDYNFTPTVNATDDSEPPTIIDVVPAPKLETAHRSDIGVYISDDKIVDSALKEELLNHPWVPDPSYVFPRSGKRNLSFQFKWLNRWKWLLYSRVVDGAFCRYCTLFTPAGVGQQSLSAGKLVKIKYDTWKNAVEDFNSHEQTKYHQNSILDADNFLAVQRRETLSIFESVNKGQHKQVAINRSILAPIIKTVIWCGRECIALRGHRDGGRIDTAKDYEHNEGHFRSLLRLRVDAGDTVLKEHLEKSGSNSMYISWKIQNEIISSCNNIILKAIVKKVNDAMCFAVLADETTDISGIQQMSLCARYVDLSVCQVREVFLQFIPVTDATGEGLANLIMNTLHNIGINTECLVAQGYDGASAMSGVVKGVQAHIRKQIPNAVYVHCSSHCLNLTISDACSVAPIRNCMGTIAMTYDFFNTPKRQAELERQIAGLESQPRVKRLKQLCATRWIKRHDSVRAFVELSQPILLALQQISSTWDDKDTACKACNLQSSIQKSEFIMSLFVVDQVFKYSLPLSKYLQTVNIDLSAGVQYAMDVQATLQKNRENADQEFKTIFDAACTTCENLDIEIRLPRVVGRQAHRSNVPSDDIEEYYRRSVFIPFIDSFIAQLDERFVSHRNILQPFQLLLPTPGSVPSSSVAEAIESLASKFHQDENAHAISGELGLWYKKVHRLEACPGNALEALQVCDRNMFPGIYKLLQIMATLPVTTCTNERSFSSLRMLKTYLRNTTGESRLNGLALLYIYKQISVDVNEVINDLAKRPRRLDFKL